MVDGSFSGLVITAVIDLVIFVILAIVFSATKNLRSRPQDATAPKNSTVKEEHGTSFMPALKGILTSPHNKHIEDIGKENWAYLQFHKIIAFVLVSFCIFGWAPLIGVYITGEESVETDVDQTGLQHIYADDDKLAAPMVFVFVFTAIYAGSLIYLAKHFIRNALHQPEPERPISANVLLAEGLPNGLVSHYHSDLLLDALKNEFEGLQGLYIVPDYAEAYRTSQTIKELRAILENLKEREAMTGKKELIRPKCCAAKVEAVALYEQQIDELEGKVAGQLDKGRSRTSGQAFIEFRSVEHAERMHQSFHQIDWPSDNYELKKWSITHAPSLDEINWHNLDANRSKVRILKIVYQVLFIVLFLVVLTPAAVLAFVGSLASELGDWIVGFIGEYIPTIIIVVYHSIILPWAINFIVRKEQHITKSAEVLSATFKYFVFMTFYVFIIPLLGLQFIEIISSAVSGSYGDWADLFAKRLVKTSRFFTIMMIHATFFANGFDLAALGTVIGVAIKHKRAVTDTDKQQIYEADPFDIAKNYALSMVYIIITVTFSVSFPIMCTLGLCFFSLRFFVHSYNLTYLFRRSVYHNIWKAVIWYFWYALCFFHLFTGALFILTQSTPYVVLGIIIMVTGVFVFVVAIVLSYKTPKAMSIEKKLEGRMDLTLADYEHPMEVSLKTLGDFEE
jgi:multisubunit Na+/H+ antiporter MnhC subunit